MDFNEPDYGGDQKPSFIPSDHRKRTMTQLKTFIEHRIWTMLIRYRNQIPANDMIYWGRLHSVMIEIKGIHIAAEINEGHR